MAGAQGGSAIEGAESLGRRVNRGEVRGGTHAHDIKTTGPGIE